MIEPPTTLTTAPTTSTGEYGVLLPVLGWEGLPALLTLATALAVPRGARVLLLGIVEVPEPRPLSDGLLAARRLRAELDTVVAHHTPEGISVQPIVRVAHSQVEAIRQAVQEQNPALLLLGWSASDTASERLFGAPVDDLLAEPPCETVVARLQAPTDRADVLLPVRGGPHTQLAYEVALALALHHDSHISLLYASNPRERDDEAARATIREYRHLSRVACWFDRPMPPDEAILKEVPAHGFIVLGVTTRPDDPEAPAGALANHILRHAPCTVLLVRHRLAPEEQRAQERWQHERQAASLVDRWFAENTFSSSEFENLHRLLALKAQQGVTISLGLPALNEEETIGEIIHRSQQALMEEVPLLDEIVLIDSGSTDRTREIARALGVPVHVHQEILPQYGSFTGKGEALWKSLHVLQGDLIVWVDTDIRNFHPRFVYGVLGPLLREPDLLYCKGFYRRPLQQGGALTDEGGGRVTELAARPLFNLFYPELSGMLQPLAGEYAGRRSALEQVPFFTGYGVESGLLIDLLERYGLHTLAQVDLHQRVHRNQELQPLSKMAFAIIQAILLRLEQRQRVHLLEAVNQNMKLIRYAEDEGFHLEVRAIRDHERPPIATLPDYRMRPALSTAAIPPKSIPA